MKRPIALKPEDIGLLLHEFANSGDLDGIGILYEDQAVLSEGGRTIRGRDNIKNFYAKHIADGTVFIQGRLQAPLVSGDLAMTASLLASGATTVEVARRQPDGSWCWVIDEAALGACWTEGSPKSGV